MRVAITKLTDINLLNAACTFTVNKNTTINSLYKMYKAEHSPTRTQLFWIELYDIATAVSVHLVRHKVGVEHFVKSNRIDRGGEEIVTRNTPINHAMFINAQALINMARKRLCSKASIETRLVMQEIKAKVKEVDEELARCMVPECIYRGGWCHEFSTCGLCPKGI